MFICSSLQLLTTPLYLCWYSSSRCTKSCHIITLGFSAKGSSDFLQVPWERQLPRAEAYSGKGRCARLGVTCIC